MSRGNMSGIAEDVRTYFERGERFFIPSLSVEGVEIK